MSRLTLNIFILRTYQYFLDLATKVVPRHPTIREGTFPYRNHLFPMTSLFTGIGQNPIEKEEDRQLLNELKVHHK